ncbi:MAG TPA: hypothetical protein VMS76_06390 [Planctomycetota bacterium]|nr:hypothetical protein [Planctomycetota bacterium]
MAEPIPGRTTQPIGAKWIVLGCLGALLALGLPCLAIAVLVCFGMRWTARKEASEDLLFVHRQVLEAEFDSDAEPKRGALLRKLEDARAMARSADLGLLEWRAYDASLRSVTQDRRITAAEAEFMERELEALRLRHDPDINS